MYSENTQSNINSLVIIGTAFFSSILTDLETYSSPYIPSGNYSNYLEKESFTYPTIKNYILLENPQNIYIHEEPIIQPKVKTKLKIKINKPQPLQLI